MDRPSDRQLGQLGVNRDTDSGQSGKLTNWVKTHPGQSNSDRPVGHWNAGRTQFDRMAQPGAHWHMSRNDLEVRRDVARIDRMIDRMEKQAAEFDSPQVTALFAKELPRLLERRARLLGLDAPEAKSEANSAGSLAELEQKLALSDRLGRGGAS